MPLSQKQMEYIALAWQCFESEPKIDYEKFKDLAGLASANSARELLRVTKKKLNEEHGSLSGELKAANGNAKKTGTPNKKKDGMPGGKSNGTPSKAATPGSQKRGRKAKSEMAEAEADDDEDAMVVSPSKKAKVEKKVEGDAEDDGFDDFGEFL